MYEKYSKKICSWGNIVCSLTHTEKKNWIRACVCSEKSFISSYEHLIEFFFEKLMMMMVILVYGNYGEFFLFFFIKIFF